MIKYLHGLTPADRDEEVVAGLGLAEAARTLTETIRQANSRLERLPGG